MTSREVYKALDRLLTAEPAGANWKAVLAPVYAAIQALEGEQEPVGWTGSGTLAYLKAGLEGFIWPSKAEAHPVALYAHPAPVGDQEGFAWVLMRNIQPHTVFLVEADAIAERDRKRASEMEWRAQNAHVADVRTYWNVDKTPLAQANPPVRSGDQERIAEWQPIETAPKDRGPIVVAFSPEDWTTAEAVWRDGEWRAACWFTHRASNYFESREHVVKPVYWQPRPVRSTPDQPKQEVKDV